MLKLRQREIIVTEAVMSKRYIVPLLLLLMLVPVHGGELDLRAEQPFDLTVRSLPVNFRGHSFESLRTVLLIPGRGKFETSDEFQKRVNATSEMRTFAFTEFLYPRDVTYDAGRNLVTVTTHRFENAGRNHRRIHVETLYGDDSNYVATNAFGVAANVKRTSSEQFFVLAPSRCDGRLSFALKPSAAKSLEYSLGLLLAVRLAPQVVRATLKSKAPTLDSPLDETVTDHTLTGSFEGAWIFNRDTGEVLARFDRDCKLVIGEAR